MKRRFLIVVLLLLPVVVFAQTQIGLAALYDHRLDDFGLSDGVSLTDFPIGLDLRFSHGILQTGFKGLFSLGAPVEMGIPHQVDLLADLMFSMPLSMMRFGIGIGPQFSFGFGEGFAFAADQTTNGIHGTVSLDVVLGGISVGFVSVAMVNPDFSGGGNLVTIDRVRGYTGISVLLTPGGFARDATEDVEPGG